MTIPLSHASARTWSATLVVLLVIVPIAIAFREDDVGETIPAHVEMNVGDSVNISCLINPTIFSGEYPCKMYFINELTRQRVPDDDIVVMNSTYIIFMLRNAREQSSRFLCKCDKDAIMESNVYVGTPPRGVNQFDCRSYDFEYMVCNFTQPENPVLTQYNLTYYINSPDYETPVSCNFDMKPLVVCNITADHSYRPHVEEYRFKVYSSNALGHLKQEFTINNLNVMIPARPGNDFHIHRLSTDSLEAYWSMPKYDSYTPNKHRGLLWEVLVQPDGFPVRDVSGQVRVVHVERGCKMSLGGLPYAHYWYELRLRVKVRSAYVGASFSGGSDADLWSSTFHYRFRTRPRKPDRPPSTDNGGFYVNSLKTEVRLYWEELEKWEENGDNFTYIIRAIEKDWAGKTRELIPSQQTASHAIFKWSATSHYSFDIRSLNHIGESYESSRITIHPQAVRSPKEYTPYYIHNVYHQTNRSYTLTWLSPPERRGLQNYTVYWCYSKLAMPTECRGSIHFRRVSRDIHRFATEPQMTEHDHSLTLAVSANYHDYNTGMHWTSCSVDVNADFEPMEPEVQAISATDLRVQWSSKTVCPSILNGYNLTYCEVANTPATDSITPPTMDAIALFESFTSGKVVTTELAACSGPPITITIDKNLNKCNITGLRPYTLYRLEMFMFSNIKVGKPSEPLLVRTFEAAPSPPRQLNVYELTNTSARISWLPPSQTNGYIRQYLVKLNNREYVVNATAFEGHDEEISFVLQNLTSFTSYKAFVIAVTRYNSDHSNDIHFTTHMSAPSKMNNLTSANKNKMEVELKWAPPTVPGGRLDYYEVAVTQLHGDYVERRRVSVVFGYSCLLRVPTCPDPDYQTNVEVRAINAALIDSNEVNPTDVLAQQIRNKFDQDVLNYEGNEDLVCATDGGGGGSSLALRERQNAQLARYLNKDIYVLYKSDWYPFTIFSCAQRELGKITAITLMVVCTTILLMTLMFFATKKWKMMSDIQCTLPAALDAYLTKELNGGGGAGAVGVGAGGGGGFGVALTHGDVGGIYAGNDFLSGSSPGSRNASLPPALDGSQERLHNEEHHLLGAHKNDSGYIGDGLIFGRSLSAVAAASAGEEDMMVEYGGVGAGGRREYLNSESSADSLIGSTNSSSGTGGGGVAGMAEMDVCPEMMVPLNRIAEEATGGYVQVPQAQAAGGVSYVTATNWNAWAQRQEETSPADNVITAEQGMSDEPQQLLMNKKDDYIQAADVAKRSGALSGYIISNDIPKLTQDPTSKATEAAAAPGLDMGSVCKNDDYIKQADLIEGDWTKAADKPVSSSGQNDYIKASDLSANTATTPATNFSSGYTTIDALSKMMTTPPTQHDGNSPHLSPEQMRIGGVSGSGGKPGLIGYVTQREMNEFGQQHQQQQQQFHEQQPHQQQQMR